MKLFVLHDGRARGGNTDDAAVMSSASSEREAREEGAEDWEGYDAVWFEYDVRGKELVNERERADLPPATPGRKP